MTPCEMAEALDGVAKVLEDVDGESHDPRLWACIAAIGSCVAAIDDEVSRGEWHDDAESVGQHDDAVFS